MKRTLCALSVLLCLALPALSEPLELWPNARYDPSVPTFAEVLGHAPGARISSHREMLRYFRALEKAVPGRIRVTPYAESWEGRELIYVTVASAERFARLDELRLAQQALADPRSTGETTARQLIVETPGSVWLAYAVHGNEISSTDAAMFTAYHLLASRDDAVVDQILSETVVFIDPLQNPDGRDRFVHGFEMAEGLAVDASSLSAEHDEPWPSGRVNHYLFDLNRDWIALTQPETRGHIAALLDWLPLVFVDLHEMGSDSTYYFAPEAVPYNPYIASDQRSSLEVFGRNNAKWFDRFGIDYFTREVFDAFYPGYGASWPLYYGAVAMTYEQASARGLAVRRTNGSELSYAESVRNHFVTSIATAEAVAENRQKLLGEFWAYRKSAIAAGEKGTVRELLLSGQPDPSAADKLAGLLVQQGVEIRRATSPFEACGRSYPVGSYAIPLAQPAHRLVRTLLDRQVPMEDDFLAEQERRRAKDLEHEIYDITSWSLPLMFNLEIDGCAKAAAGQFEVSGPETVRPGRLDGEGASVAYLVPWGTASAVRFLSAALRAGLAVKTSDKELRHHGREFPAGSLIFKVPDNPPNLSSTLSKLSTQTGAQVIGSSDSWVDEGPNFGSRNVYDVPAPRVAVAWDSPTSPYSAGATRFVIERQFGYPVTALRTAQLARADLRLFDVVILPEGRSYDSVLGEQGARNLRDWVGAGGTLVVLGSAMEFASDPDIDLLSVRRERSFAVQKEAEKKSSEGLDKAPENESTVPGQRLASEADYLAAIAPESEAPDTVPGALVRAVVDAEHWLAAGVPETVNVMVRGNDVYTPIALDKGVNVARYAAADAVLASGYLWSENREQLAFKPFAIVQPLGRGTVIGFTEDPNFRAYLDGLNLLFMNAVFRGPAHATPVR